MFTDVIYTNITYFKLQVSVPLSLIYHLWSYYNNSAIYNANKSIPTENTLDLDSALRKNSPKSKMGTSRLWMLPFPAAALWCNCHVHFNIYVISTLSCQVIFFLLFHIFQCLIHRNTLDPSEIQYHDKQISDQYKQEHFHIAHRAYAESVPSTVGKEHDPPDNLHDDDT